MDDNLNAILSEGESYTVEFKESPDKSLASEVCAFANASGGKVFIGVNDAGHVNRDGREQCRSFPHPRHHK